MKQSFMQTKIIAVVMLLLSACSQEDEYVQKRDNEIFYKGLEITVRASDFMTDGAPDTRATDNDKETTFEDEDRLGIIILDEIGTLLYNNIPYKFSDNKWLFDNTNSEGKDACYYDPKAHTYIIYYPYSPTADNIKSLEELKNRFLPRTDQSSQLGYRSSDLMFWSKTYKNPQKSLTATLTHAYTSVSLSPKITGYVLDDEENTQCSPFDTKISSANLTIDNNVYIPYYAADGSLRCILPYDFNTGNIRCFYTIGSKTYCNVISLSDVVANTRYISEPEITAIYSLGNAQVGDFYCKRNDNNNGYLIPGDIMLSKEQRTACIGIVFWLGDATAKDRTLKTDHANCTHGLVVALNDAINGTTAWQSPFVSIQDWLDEYQAGRFLPIGGPYNKNSPLNNIQGYNNTKAIEMFNDAYNADNIVRPVDKVVTYRTTCLAPANSSDWYFPSAKELTLLCGRDVANIGIQGSVGIANRKLINNQLGSISDVAIQISSTSYWASSAEGIYNNYANCVDFHDGDVNGLPKSWGYRVRCILAF